MYIQVVMFYIQTSRVKVYNPYMLM
jgi:hypothetical protein